MHISDNDIERILAVGADIADARAVPDPLYDLRDELADTTSAIYAIARATGVGIEIAYEVALEGYQRRADWLSEGIEPPGYEFADDYPEEVCGE